MNIAIAWDAFGVLLAARSHWPLSELHPEFLSSTIRMMELVQVAVLLSTAWLIERGSLVTNIERLPLEPLSTTIHWLGSLLAVSNGSCIPSPTQAIAIGYC